MGTIANQMRGQKHLRDTVHKQFQSEEHLLVFGRLDVPINLSDTLIQKQWAPTTKKSTEII